MLITECLAHWLVGREVSWNCVLLAVHPKRVTSSPSSPAYPQPSLKAVESKKQQTEKFKLTAVAKWIEIPCNMTRKKIMLNTTCLFVCFCLMSSDAKSILGTNHCNH